MSNLVKNMVDFWYVWGIGALLLMSAGVFAAQFIMPALRLKSKLEGTIVALSLIKGRGGENCIELTQISNGPMGLHELAHLWAEYTKTLHPQYEVDSSGQNRIVRWRATALAETFFSERSLVDIPLNADFYKHLPGILTGLGIIGTFLGLIIGLSSFDVSDPAAAQTELNNLINAVGHAFWVSGVAIAMAMLFTVIEKFFIMSSRRQVGKLCQLVDSLFDAGAGEEYLARLVTASETQATQAAHIKDALVTDLKEILTALTEKQLAAQSSHTERVLQAQAEQSGRMSAGVGKEIADRLEKPIATLTEAVKLVTTGRDAAVAELLMDVLSGLKAKLESLFGGQMAGMTELLKKTADAMSKSAEQFTLLASEMKTAGTGTVEEMGKTLNTAIASAEARQLVMTKQVEACIAEIQTLVTVSQTKSSDKLQETLEQVGRQVTGVVEILREQAEKSAESQGLRLERFEQSTDKAVQSLSLQMQALMAQSAETNRSLQEAVARLSSTTVDAIQKMNQGAETLSVAASDFAKAGMGVAETMRVAGEATSNIKAASGTLGVAASATKDILVDYGRTRDSFATMVTELKSVTENARRDAAMTSEIIARIEAASGKLGEAQRQSEQYLQGVNDVLAKTFESFSVHLAKAIKDGNIQFQDSLRTAVNIVSGAVKDLGDTLDDVPGRKRK